MLTAQEICSVIDAEFKGKAVDISSDACKYLTKCGKKCAIGMFIPDGHDAQQDGGDFSSMIRHNSDLWEYMPSENESFLTDFQHQHDSLLLTTIVPEQREILKQWVIANYNNFNHEGGVNE